MKRTMEVRGGQMRFQRFGPIKPIRQRKDSPAPERRGLWAFPYPYFDWYFAAHRWEYLMPKAFRERRGFDPSIIAPKRDWESMTDEECEEYWTGREEWMRKHKAKFPILSFWSPGPVWTMLDYRGYFTGIWLSMSIQEFEKAVLGYKRKHSHWDQDGLEVFLGIKAIP